MDAREVAATLVPRRFARRWAQLREGAQGLMPVTRTLQRTPRRLRPPPPRAFAAFGDGSWVVPTSRVVHPERIAIGARTVIMEHSTLWAAGDRDSGGTITIGDGVTLARFNSIVCSHEISIADDVASSDSVTVFDSWDHPMRGPASGSVPAPPGGPVVIESGAYLGFNSIIGPDVRIGRGAFVGEGAVVLDDVPAHTVVYGCPATVTRRYERAAGWEGPRWP